MPASGWRLQSDGWRFGIGAAFFDAVFFKAISG
jgi:hypothetical protein